jgi:hypothetical protein
MARALAASLPPSGGAPGEMSMGDMPTELAPTRTPGGARTVRDDPQNTDQPTQVVPGAAPTRRAPPTVVSAPTGFTPGPGGPVMQGSRFGRYQVESHIGRGGMGDVYLVRDTVINKIGIPVWRLPNNVIQSRFVKFSARWDF